MDRELVVLGSNESMGNDSTYQNSTIRGQVNAAIILLLFVIGLPWNALVIGIILKKKLYSRPSGMLMLNLAVANFLVCLVFMPFHIVLGLATKTFSPQEFETIDKACRVFVLQIALIILSVYTVALLAVDRVIYLKRPFTYKNTVTPRRMFLFILAAWIICGALGLPPLTGIGRVGYVPNLVTCSIINRDPDNPDNRLYPAYLTLIITVATVGTLIQLVGCGCIIYITRMHLMERLRLMLGLVKTHSHNPRPHTRPHNQETNRTKTNSTSSSISIISNYNKGQLQLVKVFGAIFVFDMLTVVPFIAFGIAVLIIGGVSPAVTLLHPVSYLLMLSRSVIYPVLETYLTYETRQVIAQSCVRFLKMSLCKCKICCSDRVVPTIHEQEPACPANLQENGEEQNPSEREPGISELTSV